MGKRRTYKGKFKPQHPEKYMGDVSNIIYRSSWEKKLFYFCDKNVSVLKWSSEEHIIPYVSPIDGRVHRYFPDLVCVMKTKKGIKTFMIEVKPFAQTHEPEPRGKSKKRFLEESATFAINQAKWKAAEAYCNKYGWEFLKITERELF